MSARGGGIAVEVLPRKTVVRLVAKTGEEPVRVGDRAVAQVR